MVSWRSVVMVVVDILMVVAVLVSVAATSDPDEPILIKRFGRGRRDERKEGGEDDGKREAVHICRREMEDRVSKG